MAVTLYTSRVVLSILGIEDYGIYNVVGGVVSMFTFLNGTMSGVTQRFMTYELGTGNSQKLNNVFVTTKRIHWIIAAIILILAETIGLWFVQNKLIIPDDRHVAAFWVYQFSILSTIMLVISIPYNACIIAHEKMSAFAYISILEVFLKLACVLLLPIISVDKLIMYAFFMLCIHITIRSVYNMYCRHHFDEARDIGQFDKSIAKEMIGFTSWSLFGGFASVGMNQGINILLNIFFGPAVNTARAIAVQVDTAIHSFVQNFQTAMKPQIVKTYASGDFVHMISLVFASSKFSFFLLLALSLPVFFETSYILDIWLKEVPDYSVPFLRITLLVALINTLATPLMTVANANGNIKKYQIVCGSLQLILIPAAYVTLKIISNPILVFWIYLAIAILTQVARIYIVSKLVNISINEYIYKVLLPILKVIFIAPFIPLVIHIFVSEGFVRLIFVIIISIVVVICAVYLLGLSIQERLFLLKYITNFKNKLKK